MSQQTVAQSLISMGNLLYVLTLLFLCPEVENSAVEWEAHSDLEVGYQTLFQHTFVSSGSDLGTFSVTFDYSVANNLIMFTVNEIEWHPSSAFGFQIQNTSLSNSNADFTFKVLGSTVLYQAKVTYMTVDALNFDVDVRSGSLPSNTVLSNQTGGYRSYNLSFLIEDKQYFNSLTEGIMFSIYPWNVLIDQNNGENCFLDWNKYINRTHYTVEIATEGSNLINTYDFHLVAYDRVYATRYRFFLYAGLGEFNCPSVDDCISDYIVGSQFVGHNRQFFGLSGWNFSTESYWVWEINSETYATESDYSTEPAAFTQTASIYWTKISAFLFAERTCPNSPDPFLDSSDLLALTCVSSCSAPNQYLIVSSNLCVACHYSCSTCSSSHLYTRCQSCPPTRQDPSSFPGECQCSSRYIDVGLQSCQLCSKFISGCTSCSDYDVCTACDTGMTPSTSRDQCICTDSSQTKTQSGECVSIVGCLATVVYNSVTVCTECNSTANLTLSGTACICMHGSVSRTAGDGVTIYCEFVCGNGIYSDNEECDDGNVVDGDGCSSGCLVETVDGYVCKGLLGDTSICFLYSTFTLELLGALRRGYRNTVQLYLSVSPYVENFGVISDQLSELTSIDSDSLNYSASSLSTTIDPKSASNKVNVLISFEYLETIDEASEHSITLNLNSTDYFAESASISNVRFVSQNSPLTYDESDTLTLICGYVIMGLSIACLVIALLSVVSERWIGVEMMHNCQMLYFYLFLLNDFDYTMIRVEDNLQYVNGFNQITTLSYFNYVDDQKQLLRTEYSKLFIENLNFTALLLLVPLGFAIARWTYPFFMRQFEKKPKAHHLKIKSEKKPELQLHPLLLPNILKWNFIFGNLAVLMILILSNQTIFSVLASEVNISAFESQGYIYSTLSQIFEFSMLTVTFAVFVVMVLNQINQRGETKSSPQQQQLDPLFNFDRFRMEYGIAFVAVSYCRIVLVFLTFTFEFAEYVFLGIELICLILFSVFRPYQRPAKGPLYEQLPDSESDLQHRYCYAVHNVHNIVNYAVSTIFLILIIACNTSEQNSVVYTLLEMWIVVGLFLNLVFGVLRVFFSKLIARIACNCKNLFQSKVEKEVEAIQQKPQEAKKKLKSKKQPKKSKVKDRDKPRKKTTADNIFEQAEEKPIKKSLRKQSGYIPKSKPKS